MRKSTFSFNISFYIFSSSTFLIFEAHATILGRELLILAKKDNTCYKLSAGEGGVNFPAGETKAVSSADHRKREGFVGDRDPHNQRPERKLSGKTALSLVEYGASCCMVIQTMISEGSVRVFYAECH